MKRALPLAFLLAGCTVGPDYKKPDMPVAPSYEAPSQLNAPLSMPVAESLDLTQWWKQFHDAELESLIARALAQNPEQLTAESRVREAREQEIIAGAKGLPQVNAIGNAAHLHSGSNPLQDLAGGQQGAGSWGSGSSASHGTDLSIFSAGFDATWEIDLAGGVRRSVETAEAGTDAARWQMRDGEVTLTAEIAADYVSLRSDQARMAILDAEAKSQQDTLNLIAARAKAGFVTELDVNQQRQLLASTQAQRPPLVADMLAMRHALAVLMGQPPGALDVELETTVPIPPIPPSLPIGLPSQLLRARPDIRVAERKLAQATANIGVATADLYPKFDLIAALTATSSSFPGLFNSSSLGQIGAGSITWPIFHGGQIHANIRAKEEEEKQAYYAYQKAVLGGVQDTEDALVRYEAEQQRFVALQQGENTAEASTALALQQYRAGLVMFTSVLQAQTTQLTAQDNLAQSSAALTADLVSVYKALGGGWKDDNKGEAPPREANALFEQ